MHKENQVSAPFFKDGYYYYYVYRYGKRVFRSTGEKTKTSAMQVIMDRMKNNDILNEGARRTFCTFGEYAKGFWNYDTCPVIQNEIMRRGSYSHATAQNNASQVDRFLIPHFGSKLLVELTPGMIQKWLVSMSNKGDHSSSTINKMLCNMRQILEQARLDGYIEKNPADDVKQLIVNDTVVRGCFTIEQVRLLFSRPWENELARNMCLLAAVTGMRQGEIMGLCFEQVGDGFITVDRAWSDKEGIKTTKTNYSRYIPIPKEIKDLLLSMPHQGDLVFSLDGKIPYNKKSVLDALKSEMQKAGIDWEKDNLTFHSFRHFFNTQLVSASVKGEKIRAVVGHKSLEMTEHYLHIEKSDMDEINKVQQVILNQPKD